MVSIIIPCYNCRDFIGRAIESVLAQTYKNWELILIDNNSQDETWGTLEAWQAKFPECIKIFKEIKKGAPAARNKGLGESTGEWIQFLDADDELKPEKIETQVRLGNDLKAALIIGTATILIPVKDGIKQIVKIPDSSDSWSALAGSNMGITSANLWSAAAVKNVNGWDTKLTSSQEYDLMFRILQQGGKVIFDKRVNTLIHKSDSTISKSVDNKKFENIIKNRIDLRERIKMYLIQSNQLTSNREIAIDSYIYSELMNNRIIIPEYANSYLSKSKLKVPISLKFKHLKKNFKRKLKSLIK